MISSLGSTTDSGVPPPMTSSSISTAIRPMSSTLCEMTVSAGSSRANHSMSSNAIRAMSRPMRSPRLCRMAIAPTAIGLSAASSAVGGWCSSSSACTPDEPLAAWKSPKYTSSGS